MKKFLIIFLLFLGCSEKSRPLIPSDIIAPGVKVVGYDGSSRDHRQQREAVIAHINSFTSITGFQVPKINILILKNRQDVFDICKYQGASGCVIDYYRHPSTRVACWAGSKNDVPVLGHEMVHLVINDSSHSHPRWYSWDVKFNQTSSYIRSQR